MSMFFIARRFNDLLDKAEKLNYKFIADCDRENKLIENIKSFINSRYNSNFLQRLQSFIPGTKAYEYRQNIVANLETLSKFVSAAQITMIARNNVINTYQGVINTYQEALGKRDQRALAFIPQMQTLKQNLKTKDDEIKKLKSENEFLKNSSETVKAEAPSLSLQEPLNNKDEEIAHLKSEIKGLQSLTRSQELIMEVLQDNLGKERQKQRQFKKYDALKRHTLNVGMFARAKQDYLSERSLLNVVRHVLW
jgi:predicted RNase H-like nuclease (RuvC/YqgF family)